MWWWKKHQRVWTLVPLFPLKGLGYASTHPQRDMRVIPCLHPSVLKIFHFHYCVSLYRRGLLTICSGQNKKLLHWWGEPQKIGTQLLLHRFKKSVKSINIDEWMWYRFTYERQTLFLSASNFTHFYLYTRLLRNKMFVNNLINTKSNINYL